jgi:hypothetical protein
MLEKNHYQLESLLPLIVAVPPVKLGFLKRPRMVGDL